MTVLLANAKFAALAEPFLEAGLLAASDVHVVDRLAALAGLDGDDAPEALLGLAFAMRAPRAGHTGVDLETVATSAVSERPPRRAGEPAVVLPWPAPREWAATTLARAEARGLVGPDGPFRSTGSILQPARMANYERRLASALVARAGMVPGAEHQAASLRAGVDRLFHPGPKSAGQRLAGVIAALSRTTVISGGPGTGKTTTVRALLLLLRGLGDTPPRVALAAPTGKAAARMRESLLADLPASVTPEETAWLEGLTATTLHRLLGWQPRSPSRFRHGPEQRLPHDIVIVDESSMVDIAMMCKLVEAVRDDARLVLLGDANQLASVEAGSVLADLTSLAGEAGSRLGPAACAAVEAALGAGSAAHLVDDEAPLLASSMVNFTRAFRFKNPVLAKAIAALAEASQLPVGSPAIAERLDEACALLTPAQPTTQLDQGTVVGTMAFFEHTARVAGPRTEPRPPAAAPLPPAPRGRGRPKPGSEAQLPLFVPPSSPGTPVRLGVAAAVLEEIVDAYRRCLRPLRERPQDEGHQRATLAALDGMRVLCAHRAGPFGVSGLNAAIFDGLSGGKTSKPEQWTGRLVMVRENDYEHDLWNGDVGVVSRGPKGPVVLFLRPDHVKSVRLGAMPAHETAFAMTIHKSQGSQFDHVYVVLPPEETPLLTRELIYTAVSRAKSSLTLCGDRALLRAAIDRRINRASGLRELLEDG